MTDNDSRDNLATVTQWLVAGDVAAPAVDRTECAHALERAVDDLLKTITQRQAGLVREALVAAYQLGRLSP